MLNRRNLVGRAASPALLGVLILAAGSAPAAAASAPPLRASEIAERLRHETGPGGRITSRGESLERILEGQRYPGSCITPLLLSLQQAVPPLEGYGGALLHQLGPSEGPRRTFATSVLHPSPGSFRLQAVGRAWAALMEADDSDLDGVPDEAARLLDRLEMARRDVLMSFEQTAMPPVPSDTDEPVHDVEIAYLPSSLAGYVWSGEGPPSLILDSRRIQGAEGDAFLRHQIAHLLQLQLTRDESPWWYEAHAVWAEDPGGGLAGKRADAVAAYLDSSIHGFEPDEIEAWEGGFLWPHYLITSGVPPAVLGAAWEDMAAFPGNNTRQAMDAALQRLHGTTLQEEVRVFRIWNVFLGEMADGAHYPFASDLRTPVEEAAPGDPVDWSGRGAVAFLGGEVLRLTSDPSPGGWWMRFEADPRVQWDVTLLTIPSWLGARPALAQVGVSDGAGSAAIPWEDLAGIFVVVQNLGGERRVPAGFRLHAAYDALVPFDLMAFSATDEGAGTVSLQWKTEREMDLLGWRIYRSRDPYSGFEPIHTLIVPAIGGPDTASYLFLDDPPGTARKYYYLLEGITGLGFREVTYPVSVRLQP